MKALILSVKAGYGHHSTGLAMKDCFNKHGIECEMLDTLEYINRYLGEGVQEGYLLTTKYMKEAYGRVYDTLDKKEEPRREFSPELIISKHLSKKLESYMLDYASDFVIGTHSYAAVLITILKKRGILSCPTFGVVTDFTVHPFWETTALDYYVLADGLLTTEAERKGIMPRRILPYGIPIRDKFSSRTDKATAKRLLGLSSKPIALVMMGSMGFGSMTDIISACDNAQGDFQVVVICGSNEKAKAAIEEIQWKKEVRCLGFTSNVDEYMDASDVIITKPGGLTTSEAMAKGLPLILLNPIPGQEERNLEFLVNSGAAMMISKTFPLETALNNFFGCPWRRELMEKAATNMGKPSAAEDLYEFINNLVYTKSEKELKSENC